MFPETRRTQANDGDGNQSALNEEERMPSGSQQTQAEGRDVPQSTLNKEDEFRYQERHQAEDGLDSDWELVDSGGDGELEGWNGLGAQEANQKDGHDVEDSSSSVDIGYDTDATSLEDMDFTTPAGGSEQSNGSNSNNKETGIVARTRLLFSPPPSPPGNRKRTRRGDGGGDQEGGKRQKVGEHGPSV